MEADWELEIGGDAPLIEARWAGLVDLRAHPERVSEISECRDLPGLADALLKLNAADSAVWTSKADVFLPERIDPDEMNASADEACAAIACYIDVLPVGPESWSDVAQAEGTCKRVCAQLATHALRCCRVDLVIRRAFIEEVNALGATVYAVACGTDLAQAKNRLSESLVFLAATFIRCDQR